MGAQGTAQSLPSAVPEGLGYPTALLDEGASEQQMGAEQHEMGPQQPHPKAELPLPC